MAVFDDFAVDTAILELLFKRSEGGLGLIADNS